VNLLKNFYLGKYMDSFEALELNKSILEAVKELGFEKPMPIQEKMIPLMLQEKCDDIIALAQTGTGKTAAFGLPIINKTDIQLKHIQYLIIAPTRELCLQIADDLKDFATYNKNIKIAAVFGGSSMDRQIQKIKQGAQIISATPGRLLDLINREVVNLNNVKAVILDEADEMLNMGFKEELEAILEQTPKNRNTFLFSATMPKQLLSIANRYMKNPVEVTIGKRNSGAENVEHQSYFVHARDKYLALKRIVDFHPNIYGIVFCRTRKETKEIAEKLVQDGYNADALHGDLSQSQREAVLNKFRTRHLKILVATDVAARGLDVEDLTHILNYDLPDELEIYTHRSGRTGRAGKTGTSIVIANLKERYKLSTIEKQLNKNFINMPIPSGKEICEKQLFHLVDRVEKVEVDTEQVDSFLPKIYEKLEWMDRNELIQRFVSIEFNRFLDYYKSLPDLRSPKDDRTLKDNRSGERSKSSRGNYTRYFLNLGITDGLKPASLIGMINDFTGIKDIEVGQIEILKNFSFFEADSNYQSEIMDGFKGQYLRKREINIEIAEKRRGGGNKPKFRSDRKNSDGYKKSGFPRDRKERTNKKDFNRDNKFSRDRKR
jgi:ATP-dependent RNA helicase DeaD